MKKLFLLVVLFCVALSANNDMNDIKILIKQNAEFIKQNAEYIKQNAEYIKQNGTKITILQENVKNTKEQFAFMQNLIFMILAGVFGLPIYFNNKQREEERIIRDKVKDIIVALKELAQDDPKIKRSLEVSGIL